MNPLRPSAFCARGMIVVNVNPLYTPRELEHQLNDSGGGGDCDRLQLPIPRRKWSRKLCVKHADPDPDGDQLSTAKAHPVNFVVKYIKRLVPKHITSDRRSSSQQRRCMPVIACSTLEPDIVCADLAFLQYTGGTAGVAKGRCSPTAICWLTSSR